MVVCSLDLKLPYAQRDELDCAKNQAIAAFKELVTINFPCSLQSRLPLVSASHVDSENPVRVLRYL